jgi:undecaprenyl-diphosphatase
MEFLSDLDTALFFFINLKLANPVTNFFMPIITDDRLLRVIYATAMIILLWKGNARLRWMVLFSIIALTLADQISAGLLKDMIGRPRPCHIFDHNSINMLVHCGTGKSMPSAHAANVFAQAVFFSYSDRQPRIYLFTFATLVALSRVFVGVHYPGDIIVGSLLGTVIGLIIILLFIKIKNKLPKVSDAV